MRLRSGLVAPPTCFVVELDMLAIHERGRRGWLARETRGKLIAKGEDLQSVYLLSGAPPMLDTRETEHDRINTIDRESELVSSSRATNSALTRELSCSSLTFSVVVRRRIIKLIRVLIEFGVKRWTQGSYRARGHGVHYSSLMRTDCPRTARCARSLILSSSNNISL